MRYYARCSACGLEVELIEHEADRLELSLAGAQFKPVCVESPTDPWQCAFLHQSLRGRSSAQAETEAVGVPGV